MDDKDIVALIQEEEKRLQERRKQIEDKVVENNNKFDDLMARKTKVMEKAAGIMTEEKDIQEQGKLIQLMAGECQSIQDQLVKIQNTMGSASAEEKAKMSVEAPQLQSQLKEKYEKYQAKDAEYRVNVENHNQHRRDIHDQMASLDPEAKYGK